MTTHVRTPPKQVFGSAGSLLLSLSPNSPTPCLSFPQQHVRSELSFANASISVQIHLAEDLRWDPQFLLVGIFEAIQERCNSANLGLGRRLPHDCIVQSKSKHCWVLAILGYTHWTLRASSDILSDCISMPLSIVKSHMFLHTVNCIKLSSSSCHLPRNVFTSIDLLAFKLRHKGTKCEDPKNHHQSSKYAAEASGRGVVSESHSCESYDRLKTNDQNKRMMPHGLQCKSTV